MLEVLPERKLYLPQLLLLLLIQLGYYFRSMFERKVPDPMEC